MIPKLRHIIISATAAFIALGSSTTSIPSRAPIMRTSIKDGVMNFDPPQRDSISKYLDLALKANATFPGIDRTIRQSGYVSIKDEQRPSKPP